jgi:hypothetical protein
VCDEGAFKQEAVDHFGTLRLFCSRMRLTPLLSEVTFLATANASLTIATRTALEPMNKWLTFDETCMELRLAGKAVRNMLRSGLLVGYQVPLRHRDPKSRGKFGAWRILNPGAKFARHLKESERHLEHVVLLNGREVAEVLGLKSGTIRQLKKRGQLRGQSTPNGTLYTVEELRRFLLRRESKAEGRKLYSPTLGRWAQALVSQDATVQAEVLDELLKQAVGLAEPLKSKYVVEVWQHFDGVNSLLRSARLGEDLALAINKAKPKQLDLQPLLPRTHVLSKYLNFGDLHP